MKQQITTARRGPIVCIIIGNNQDGMPDNEAEVIKKTQQAKKQSNRSKQPKKILPTLNETKIPARKKEKKELTNNIIRADLKDE